MLYHSLHCFINHIESYCGNMFIKNHILRIVRPGNDLHWIEKVVIIFLCPPNEVAMLQADDVTIKGEILQAFEARFGIHVNTNFWWT